MVRGRSRSSYWSWSRSTLLILAVKKEEGDNTEVNLYKLGRLIRDFDDYERKFKGRIFCQ